MNNMEKEALYNKIYNYTINHLKEIRVMWRTNPQLFVETGGVTSIFVSRLVADIQWCNLILTGAPYKDKGENDTFHDWVDHFWDDMIKFIGEE